MVSLINEEFRRCMLTQFEFHLNCTHSLALVPYPIQLNDSQCSQVDVFE